MLTNIRLPLLLSSIALSALNTPVFSADVEKGSETITSTFSRDKILKQFEDDRKQINRTIDSTKQATQKMLDLIPEDVWPQVSPLANIFIDSLRKLKGIHGVQYELSGPVELLKFLAKHPDIRQDYPHVYVDLFTLYNKLTIWDVWAQEIHNKIRSSIGTLTDDRYSSSLIDKKERTNLFLTILPFLNQYLDYGKPATSKRSYSDRYSLVYKETLRNFMNYTAENFSKYHYNWSHGSHTTCMQRNPYKLTQTLKLSFPLLGDMLTRGEQNTRLTDVIEVLYDLKSERQNLIIQTLNTDITTKLTKINDLTDVVLFLSILAEDDVKDFVSEVVTFTNGLLSNSREADGIYYKLREAPLESRGKIIQRVNEKSILVTKESAEEAGFSLEHMPKSYLISKLTAIEVDKEIKAQEATDTVTQ